MNGTPFLAQCFLYVQLLKKTAITGASLMVQSRKISGYTSDLAKTMHVKVNINQILIFLDVSWRESVKHLKLQGFV